MPQPENRDDRRATSAAIHFREAGHDGFTVRQGNIDPSNDFFHLEDVRDRLPCPDSGGLQEGQETFFAGEGLLARIRENADWSRIFWCFYDTTTFGYRFSPDGLRIYSDESRFGYLRERLMISFIRARLNIAPEPLRAPKS